MGFKQAHKSNVDAQFKKQKKTPVRSPLHGKRGPGKITLKGREALSAIIDGNADRLQGWIDAIEKKEGPAAALRGFVSLLDYVIPRQSRSQLIGADESKDIVIRWQGFNDSNDARPSSNEGHGSSATDSENEHAIQ